MCSYHCRCIFVYLERGACECDPQGWWRTYHSTYKEKVCADLKWYIVSWELHKIQNSEIWLPFYIRCNLGKLSPPWISACVLSHIDSHTHKNVLSMTIYVAKCTCRNAETVRGEGCPSLPARKKAQKWSISCGVEPHNPGPCQSGSLIIAL
jgi:hypothetical protein